MPTYSVISGDSEQCNYDSNSETQLFTWGAPAKRCCDSTFPDLHLSSLIDLDGLERFDTEAPSKIENLTVEILHDIGETGLNSIGCLLDGRDKDGQDVGQPIIVRLSGGVDQGFELFVLSLEASHFDFCVQSVAGRCCPLAKLLYCPTRCVSVCCFGSQAFLKPAGILFGLFRSGFKLINSLGKGISVLGLIVKVCQLVFDVD
jgi:hypothetical protein